MTKVVYKTRTKRFGCLFWFFFFILTFAIVGYFSLRTGISLLGETFKIPERHYGSDEFPDLQETWSYGQGSNKVVRIPITGMITLKNNNSLFAPSASSVMALKAIHRATRDKKVQAIILEIDSGGGGITASDIIFKALLDFKKDHPNRKIVAIYGDVAASGAYYISLAADHIIARPTSVTGSIGVLVPSVNIFNFVDSHGIKDTTVKSGSNKDMLNPLAKPSEEQHQIMQGVVNSLYQHFVELVAARRHLPEDEVYSLADGRIFTAQDALRKKLIDEIGYWDDAMTRTAELLDVDNIKVFRYEPSFSIRDIMRASQKLDPHAMLSIPDTPRIQYRWH